jgi:hypothetical protein
VSEYVEISVIRAHFEKDIFRSVPLVKYFFDEIIAVVELKPHRPLIGLCPRIALHPQLHHFIIGDNPLASNPSGFTYGLEGPAQGLDYFARTIQQWRPAMLYSADSGRIE